MSLSAEQRESFTKVIDSILAISDLNTISSKRVRQGLQKTVDYDLNEFKDGVKALIMERFDIFAYRNNDVSSTTSQHVIPSTETTNGHGTHNGKAANNESPTPSTSSSRKRPAESDQSEEPESQKRRTSHDVDVDADAIFAAKLQAEENKRARPTRGSATRKVAPPKKKIKSKTARKVKAEDDSDLDSSSETGKKKVNRSGGFHKLLDLSAPLSELLGGETQMSRPQVVKRVWDYIKQNELQDPTDRRQIRCDEPMRRVFKQDRVHMFTMNRFLNQNLYEPGE